MNWLTWCAPSAELPLGGAGRVGHACGGVGLSGSGLSLRLHTERAAVARRAYLILKELYGVKAEVRVSQGSKLAQRNRYALAAPPGGGHRPDAPGHRRLHPAGGPDRPAPGGSCPSDQRVLPAGLPAGRLSGGGFLADPAKAYHLEFVAGDDQLAFQTRNPLRRSASRQNHSAKRS